MIRRNKVIHNTLMLYIMSIAKLLFPLVTLPYLTRVLTEESYGMVSYVKSSMAYMQSIIDFGFILSSVKEIVKVQEDKEAIGKIVGDTYLAKLVLSVIAFVILCIMCYIIPILRMDIKFVILNFISILLYIFIPDFLFRGIEKMHLITLSFVVAKGVSVLLTFYWVKNDADLLFIPILDIITNLISILISTVFIKKIGILIRITNIRNCFHMIRESFIYFLSNIASTAFTALNTLLIGIFISDLTQIAYWSVCLSIISSIQGLYAPICNSVYPYMIKEKSLKFIHKTLAIFMPIVTVGCIISFVGTEIGLYIVGGEKYIGAASLFRCMIPILFFSFPVQIYGWPTLGAIGKEKETTISTILAAFVQTIGLLLLGMTNLFTTVNLAVLRSFSELILLVIRMFFTYKNREFFQKEQIFFR